MPSRHRLRILLVEDDATSRRFLAEALAHAGHDARPCADLGTALAAAAEERFDLVLTDLALPDGDGETLFGRLRSGPGTPNRPVPVVALSADISPQSRIRLLRMGFAAVLEKPVTIAALEGLLGGLQAGVADPGGDSDWDATAQDRNPKIGTSPLPDLDDTAALRATATPEILAGLRRLFRGELPGQLDLVERALASGDRTSARAILHRLSASCGFCGAPRLKLAARTLDQALAVPGVLPASLVASFLDAGRRVLEKLRSAP